MSCIQLVMWDHGSAAPLIQSSVQTSGGCLCQGVWLQAKYSLSKALPDAQSKEGQLLLEVLVKAQSRVFVIFRQQ